MIKWLNNFFLCDEDEGVSVSDAAWFYGFYILMAIVLLVTAFLKN